jgi:hypothetical protein
MTLQQRITLLAQGVGADIKALFINQGSLPALTTTNKTSLVSAINEVKAAFDAAGTPIDDALASSLVKTYSIDKIKQLIAQVKAEILGGASAAYDTLLEIQSALQGDDTDISTLLTAVGNRIRFDAAQTLTAGQITQAAANMGLGEPDTDLLAIYVAAKA